MGKSDLLGVDILPKQDGDYIILESLGLILESLGHTLNS